MAATGGWRKILSGWYCYENAAGKELAYVERAGSRWIVRVLPLANDAAAFSLSEKPTTLREAQRLAQNAYVHTSRKMIKEGVQV